MVGEDANLRIGVVCVPQTKEGEGNNRNELQARTSKCVVCVPQTKEINNRNELQARTSYELIGWSESQSGEVIKQ
jgi:hypothetical protein